MLAENNTPKPPARQGKFATYPVAMSGVLASHSLESAIPPTCFGGKPVLRNIWSRMSHVAFE